LPQAHQSSLSKPSIVVSGKTGKWHEKEKLKGAFGVRGLLLVEK
jgi:hypothetical protein